jgi:hypothetical protein
MDPNTIVQLALLVLQQVLNLIGEIRGQGGLTDDQIAAQVATITQGNDAAYAQIMAALATLPAPTPKPVVPPTPSA